MLRVLVIEDDAEVAAFIAKGLAEQGHSVDRAAEGKTGLVLATTEDYDVMVIDRMLPELDGLTIVRSVRGTGKQTPILILSALGEVDSRVQGLRAGGDDYLTKPFAFSELLARIEALARRAMPRAETESTLRVICSHGPLRAPAGASNSSPANSGCSSTSCATQVRW